MPGPVISKVLCTRESGAGATASPSSSSGAPRTPVPEAGATISAERSSDTSAVSEPDAGVNMPTTAMTPAAAAAARTPEANGPSKG